LGIEVCSTRNDVVLALQPLAHASTWLTVTAERAVSRAMGGSCSMPLAAHATYDNGVLSLRAAWGDAEGAASLVQAQVQQAIDVSDHAQARLLGERVAQSLQKQGAVCAR
jgi:hydroxymethylbilane synthase